MTEPTTPSAHVRCRIVLSHVRTINGQTVMLEPAFCDVLDLPDDAETKLALNRGWVITVAPNEKGDSQP